MRFRTRPYNLSKSACWRDQERSRVFVHQTFAVLIFTKEMKQKEWFQCLCSQGRKLSLGSCSTVEGDRINAFIDKEKPFTGFPRFLGPGARIYCLQWVLGERWSIRDSLSSLGSWGEMEQKEEGGAPAAPLAPVRRLSSLPLVPASDQFCHMTHEQICVRSDTGWTVTSANCQTKPHQVSNLCSPSVLVNRNSHVNNLYYRIMQPFFPANVSYVHNFPPRKSP